VRPAGGAFLVADDRGDRGAQLCQAPFLLRTGPTMQTELLASELATTDDNRNGLLCMRTATATGNVMVHDDTPGDEFGACRFDFALEQTGGLPLRSHQQ